MSLICGILKISKQKQKQAHKYREQLGGCQRWGGGWKKWVKGVKGYKEKKIMYFK